MIIISDWNHIEFHDAVVQAVQHQGEVIIFELDQIFLDLQHPENSTDKPLCLSNIGLVFKHPQSVSMRVYNSDLDTWEFIDPPFPVMETVAEVTITPDNLWKISGFIPDGRWLEWQIQVGESVKIEAPDFASI